MFDKIDASLGFHQEAMRLRAYRQEILSSNIANADTPGYRARDIDFASELRKVVAKGEGAKIKSESSLSLAMTSTKHIPAKASIFPDHGLNLLYRIPDQPSADGNTVDMDRERINFADNSFRYQADVNFINGRIRSMMTVLQQ